MLSFASSRRVYRPSPVFVHAVLNNLRLLISVPIMTALALVIALILNGQVHGWRQYRAIVFLPYILPATAIGLVFSFLLAQSGGFADKIDVPVGASPHGVHLADLDGDNAKDIIVSNGDDATISVLLAR